MDTKQRTHIVIQPSTWYDGETLCSGWAMLSDAQPKANALNFAKHFPEAEAVTMAEAAQAIKQVARHEITN